MTTCTSCGVRPPRDSASLAAQLEDATLFATTAHEGQVDKAGLPYILHPLAVSDALAPDRQAQIVGVLHDVMEDCGVSWQTLYLRYGYDVANAVEALSRQKGEKYSEFILRVKRNPLARKVKIVDIRHNITREVKPEDEGWKASMIRTRYQPALAELEEE